MSNESQPDTRIPLAIERTDMAIFRTSLALDRTTLAWIRTTLTMATFGLGMIGFFRTIREHAETPETIRLHQSAIHFGVALVVIGIVSTLFGSDIPYVESTEAPTRRNSTSPTVAVERHDLRSNLTDGSL